MNIQDELGVTFIVVTHDQEEAMILSSRIAVMEKGRFLQVGAPKEIYEYPGSRFVANFIGTINTFEGVVTRVDDDGFFASAEDAGSELRATGEHGLNSGATVCIAIRPEKIFISKNAPENDTDTTMRGIVEDLGYFGNISLYRIRLDSGKILQVSAQNRTRSAQRFLEWDDKVWVSWRPRSAVVITD